MCSVTPLSQQTILITGATDGLGRHLAEHLARSGARLLLHGRDAGRGADTLRAIRAATGNARLEFVQADFASLAEVRAMGARLAAELERLDALVNNAGIGSGGSNAPRALGRPDHNRYAPICVAGPYTIPGFAKLEALSTCSGFW